MKLAVSARLRTFCRVEGGAVKATPAMHLPSDVGISEAGDISLTRFVHIVHRRPSVFVTSGATVVLPLPRVKRFSLEWGVLQVDFPAQRKRRYRVSGGRPHCYRERIHSRVLDYVAKQGGQRVFPMMNEDLHGKKNAVCVTYPTCASIRR